MHVVRHSNYSGDISPEQDSSVVILHRRQAREDLCTSVECQHVMTYNDNQGCISAQLLAVDRGLPGLALCLRHPLLLAMMSLETPCIGAAGDTTPQYFGEGHVAFCCCSLYQRPVGQPDSCKSCLLLHLLKHSRRVWLPTSGSMFEAEGPA
jgi:hypothetical protein